MAKSELDGLISEIKKSTKQTSINKIDEVRVMKCMLNDPDFKIGVYDINTHELIDDRAGYTYECLGKVLRKKLKNLLYIATDCLTNYHLQKFSVDVIM